MNLAGLAHIYDLLAGLALDYAVALIAVGVTAMALIEVMHRASSARMRFHRHAIASAIDRDVGLWDLDEAVRFREAMEGLVGDQSEHIPPAVHEDQYYWVTSLRIYGDLVHLSTGCRPAESNPLGKPLREEISLFSLETRELFDRLRAAAEIVLASPYRHPELYRLFVRGADLESQLVWMRECCRGGEPTATTDAALTKRILDTGAELAHLARVNLDSSERSIQGGWSRLNHVRAMLMGLLLMLVAQVMVFHTELATGTDIMFKLALLLAASIPGGFAAPLARDILSLLQRLRRQDLEPSRRST